MNQKDNEIKTLKAKITKDETEERKNTLEVRKVKEQKEHLSNEVAKMKAFHDPSSLSLQDIIPKLQALDPCKFREVMHDLEYEGDDPNWWKMDFLEKLNINHDPAVEENLKQLSAQQQKLVDEKAQLASELARTQNLLKLQVDIDKENSSLQ